MNNNAGYRSMSVREVHAIQTDGDVIDLVDVRTPGEFAAVHADGARSVPLNTLNAESVKVVRQDAPDHPLYIICQSGGRSSTACDRLAAAGVNVVNVDGGTSAWQSAGLPVVRAGGGHSRGLPPMVRRAGLLLAVVGLILGFTVNGVFLWAAAGLWITLLVVNGGCPLDSCAIATSGTTCAQSQKRG